MKRSPLVWFVLFVALSTVGPALAEKGREGPMAKLPQSLVTLYEQHTSPALLNAQAPSLAANPLVTVFGDRVVIDAIAEDNVETLKAELIALGMENATAYGRIVSGLLPIAKLPAAAELASLRFAQAPVFITNAGLVTSQGDIAQRSNLARSNFSVDGTGVRVGVLSDSFNCLGGAPADVTNGDLSPVTVLQELPSCTNGTDEGRAMLQIVHDVAPGASLAFATAAGGTTSFASNIIALRNNGAKVIVDDVLQLNEPMFQDGIIAQAVNAVVANGAAYFSSAGNMGRMAYEAPFRNSGINLGGIGPFKVPVTTFIAHDFDPSPGVDVFETITIPAGVTRFSFQWADRYASVSVSSPGAATDLDIAIFDMAGNFLAGNFDPNAGLDPIVVDFLPIGGQFQVAIGKFSGPDPSLMKLVSFDAGIIFNEHPTNSGTIYGHFNAALGVAVGAANYWQTPAFGISPPILHPASSAGTTPILFDLAGNPINDPRAFKPEIVAPHCADTTFFSAQQGDIDGSGFPNFCGTSAAAPHAAGVAALLFQANPALTPAQLYTALQSTALDMGAPGFDNDSGFGLIRADAAVSTVIQPSDTTPPTVTARTPAPGATGVSTATAVTATFSEDVNPATVNASTFQLRDVLNNLFTAAVSYNAGTRTATLTPSFPLANLATYTARIVGGGSGVKDLAGNALAADVTWSFATAQSAVLPPPTNIFSAVLPVSRSAVVGSPVTVFGTIINAGTSEAATCGVALAPTAPAGLSLLYQTTNPATNQVIGLPNTPVNIAPGAAQSFVVALTPSAPFAPVDMPLVFDCENSPPAPAFVGVNTLLISASTTPVPDVVALAATLSGNGIVNIPGTSGTGFFAVASVNVGAGGAITVAADTGSAPLPVSLTLCQTNPGTGTCLQPPAGSVPTTIASGATPTFAIFVQGTGSAVPFNPAVNRVFVRFRDAGGIVRGATSVAVTTP